MTERSQVFRGDVFDPHDFQIRFETNVLDQVRRNVLGQTSGEIDQAAFLNECRRLLEFAVMPPELTRVTLLTFAKGIGTRFLMNDPIIVDPLSLVDAYQDKRGDQGLFGDSAIKTAVDALNVMRESGLDKMFLDRTRAQIEGVYMGLVSIKDGVYVVV